jgi:uncharacterized membrane protein (Fun14 family)
MCHNLWQISASLTIGGLIGLLWGYIINSTNNKNLVIITGINNKEVCSTPKYPKFKCKKGKKMEEKK